jgi:hypothetical protein
MKKCRRWILTALVLVGVGLLALMWPQESARSKYLKIRLGMTRAEVEAILGQPQEIDEGRRWSIPWSDVVELPEDEIGEGEDGAMCPPVELARWIFAGTTVEVQFGKEGTVVIKECRTRFLRIGFVPLDNLCRWLKFGDTDPCYTTYL